MPSGSRITIRLSPDLEALVAVRVRQGSRMSDIVREALEAYFGVRPTGRRTATSAASAKSTAASDDTADVVTDMLSAAADSVSTLRADLSDVRTRLAALEQRMTDLTTREPQRLPQRQTSRPTSRPTPRATATAYDANQAYARMQALQAEGLTLAQIAAQLTAEGLRTRHGKAWHKSTVAYMLKTHGR